MKKYIKKLLTLFNKLIPVNKKMILLESNPAFSDNTGALYEEMILEKIDEKYEIIWLVFDKHKYLNGGNHKQIYYSFDTKLLKYISLLKLNYLYARAKYNFHSHRYYSWAKPKKSQIVVNLTHGTPIKDSSGRHSSQEYVTYIASPSEFSAKLRNKTYIAANNKFEIVGFPRNDLLLNDKQPKNLILWLPTYRKHINQLKENEADNFPLSPNKTFWNKLNLFLANNNYKLIIKPHPAQILKFESKHSNISFIDDSYLIENQTSLYSLLNISKILITDYSSVYLDYLLLNRPIIFTFDDLKEYDASTGFTVENIAEYAPGEQVETADELLNSLSNIIEFNNDNYEEKRVKMNELFNEYQDDKNSNRILKLVGLIN